MYRHHDHLHGWVSGFQKVLESKDVVLSVSASVSSVPLFILSLGASSMEVELWAGGRIPPNYCSAVLCSSTVCVYEMRVQPCVAVYLRDEGIVKKQGQKMVVRADHSGNEVMAGRATESVGGVGVDAARRTRRGGDRGGVGGVLPAVSLQTVREESILHEEGVL